MWLRVVVGEKPTLINGDHILKVVDRPQDNSLKCEVYFSPIDFIVVDQPFRQISINLGFEERG
jgi:hypothetical protein